MTLPAWPSTIPRPLASGYGLDPRPATIRTELDSGTARQRQRFTRTPTDAEWNLHLTAAQYAILDAWWHFKLNDGADWFTVQLKNGQADQTVTARFKAAPIKAEYIALDRWRVACSVEVDAMPRMTESALDALLP